VSLGGAGVRGAASRGLTLVRAFWLAEGVCSLPAERLADLPPGVDREQVRRAVSEGYSSWNAARRLRLTNEYHAFLSRMAVGDLVLTNDGAEVYVGEVTGPPV